MYVALFPCNECAKLIIQAGVRKVIFVSDKYHDRPEMVASRRLLDMAGVEAVCVAVVRRPDRFWPSDGRRAARPTLVQAVHAVRGTHCDRLCRDRWLQYASRRRPAMMHRGPSARCRVVAIAAGYGRHRGGGGGAPRGARSTTRRRDRAACRATTDGRRCRTQWQPRRALVLILPIAAAAVGC